MAMSCFIIKFGDRLDGAEGLKSLLSVMWPALHETITRNHQCRSIWPTVEKSSSLMETVSPLPGEKHSLAKV
ncbi:hypothetical protein CSW74_27540 [Shigella sonnei]|nr:hypothetical protein CSW74_27540 [Shigella sonnei]